MAFAGLEQSSRAHLDPDLAVGGQAQDVVESYYHPIFVPMRTTLHFPAFYEDRSRSASGGNFAGAAVE
jgi:hypothetical protein